MLSSPFVNALEITGGLFADEDAAKQFSLLKMNSCGAFTEFLGSDVCSFIEKYKSDPDFSTKEIIQIMFRHQDRDVILSLLRALRVSVSELIRSDYRHNTYHSVFKHVLIDVYETAQWLHRKAIEWGESQKECDFHFGIKAEQVILVYVMIEIIRQQSFFVLRKSVELGTYDEIIHCFCVLDKYVREFEQQVDCGVSKGYFVYLFFSRIYKKYQISSSRDTSVYEYVIECLDYVRSAM